MKSPILAINLTNNFGSFKILVGLYIDSDIICTKSTDDNGVSSAML